MSKSRRELIDVQKEHKSKESAFALDLGNLKTALKKFIPEEILEMERELEKLEKK